MKIDIDKIFKRARNTGVSPYTLIKRKIEYKKTNSKIKNCGKCQLRRECDYPPEHMERDYHQYECEQCGEEYGIERQACPKCEWPIGKVLRCDIIGMVIKPEARVTKKNVCSQFKELKPEIIPANNDQLELELTGGY